MSKPNSKNRRKPKKNRAGCALCKPWKQNGQTYLKHSDKKKQLRQKDG